MLCKIETDFQKNFKILQDIAGGSGDDGPVVHLSDLMTAEAGIEYKFPAPAAEKGQPIRGGPIKQYNNVFGKAA